VNEQSHVREDAAVEVSQAVRGPDSPLQSPDVQDLIILLLHTAVQVGGTLECLDRFAGLCPEADPGLAMDLAEAMQVMSGARTTLIRCADELAPGSSAR
jgi:hypothetical protein